MRSIVTTALLCWLVVGSGLRIGEAWGPTGHQVVALIALDNVSDETRKNVVALMQQAPPEAGLANLFPKDGRPLDARERDFVRIASTWPDLVRSVKPAERHAFHRRTWHFRDFYWKQEQGRAVDVPDLSVDQENLLERLQAFQTMLMDKSQPPGQRAIAMAWVLHLVGDVHQPLHCSGPVTSMEPKGDEGGNLFRLDRDNLHSYWDSMLDKAVVRRKNEGTTVYLSRATALVVARHPRALLVDQLKPGKFEDWARESLADAKKAYPASLKRNQAPSDGYREKGTQVARERIAFGGYRLALVLEQVAGQ